MKKILIALFVFASLSYGQVIETLGSVTVADSATKTFVLPLGSNQTYKVDSISIQGIFTGEIDIDELVVTKGTLVSGTFVAIATPDTTVLTIDNAASTTTAAIYTATSTGLNSLEGVDAISIKYKAGSSGNDATDPNALKVKVFKYLSSMR